MEDTAKAKSEDLPQNRRQLFFRTVRAEWKTLLLCGVIILLFSLPLHAFQIYDDLYGNMLSAQYAAGQLTEEEVNSLYKTFLYIRWLSEIALYVLFAVALAGVARIIRLLAFGEKVSFMTDFKTGIKQNIGQYAALAFIVGVVRVAVLYCIYSASVSTLYSVAGSILLGYSALFLIPVAAYLTAVVAVYDSRFYGSLKTAFGVFMRSFFRSVGFIALLLLPYLLQLIPDIICHIVFRVLLSLASGAVMFMWFLFAFYRFDVTVNEEQHPELFNKGLG